MTRENMRMTAEAEADYREFRRWYGSDWGCSCHISPPCGGCVHPGNPTNLEEDDDAWEPDMVPRYILPADVPPPAGMTRAAFAEWSDRVCGLVPANEVTA